MKWLLRILGTLVVLVVVAVGALLMMGMRKDAGTLDSSVEIDRPPSAVWPWITEAEKQKKWVSWLVDIKTDTPNDRGVGSKSVWIMEDKYNNNRRMEINGEVTAVDPGKYVAVKMETPGAFDGVASYTLVDLGNGRTRMESRGKYHYASAFARFMEPLITPQAAKKMNSDLAALKRMVEAEPVVPALAR